MSILDILGHLINGLVTYILIPLVLAAIPVVLVKARGYIKDLIESFITKHKNDSMAALAEIVTNALHQLEITVDAAVSANMVFAEKYKQVATDGKLSDAEIKELQDLAKQLVYDTIPPSIKSGNILEVLGGQAALDKLIAGMIEKALIDIKAKTPVKLLSGTALLTSGVTDGTCDATEESK